MDLNMPHMDGWAFLAAYSSIADKLPKKIPIYIMSSSISDSDISKAQANSLVADYHIKPMDEKAVQEIIDKFKALQ
jgi:CheY-like chemotaxis protein